MSKSTTEYRALLASSTDEPAAEKYDDYDNLAESSLRSTESFSQRRISERHLLYLSFALNILLGIALTFTAVPLSRSVQWRGAKPLWCE